MEVGLTLCDDLRMAYDMSRLAQMGKRHIKLRAELAALRMQMEPEIIAADLAGAQQKDIAEASGYTRESIRQICLTPEEREAERDRRRKKTSPKRHTRKATQ